MDASGQHARTVMQMLQQGAAVRSEVVASWERCIRLHGLDPESDRPIILTAGELKQTMAPIERQLRMAETELQSLAGKVARAGFFLSVVNREGATTHVGKVPDDGVPRAKVQDGIIWSEGVQGTNAAGTGLFSHRPIIIHRGEHFLAANTAMSCLVSPLYDETGAVLGVLNIATLDKSFDRAMSPFMLTALTAAAQRMEALWFREAFRDFFIVSLPEASGSNGSTPLLAVDAGLNVVGATHAARACYEIDPGAIGSGLSLGQIVTGLPVGAISIRDAERTVLQRALAQTDQNVTLATKQLGISRATMYRKMKSLSVRRKGR